MPPQLGAPIIIPPHDTQLPSADAKALPGAACSRHAPSDVMILYEVQRGELHAPEAAKLRACSHTGAAAAFSVGMQGLGGCLQPGDS